MGTGVAGGGVAGRVVLLNDPSSAGKSSIAKALVALMPTPWLNLPVDLVHAIRSRPDLVRPAGYAMSDEDWQAVFRRSRSGYHRMLAGLATAGNGVVGDHVLSEPWRIDTSLDTVTEAAARVRALADAGPGSTAFERMRRAVPA